MKSRVPDKKDDEFASQALQLAIVQKAQLVVWEDDVD